MSDSTTAYRTVTPYLVVPDADAELAFLKAAFGATEDACQRNADNSVAHAEITIGNSLVMLGQAGGPFTPRTAAFYLWVDASTRPTPRLCARARPRKARPRTSPTGTAPPGSSIRMA
jgi:uncharacterized glyoxalase superfamily protein PhnB